MSQFIIFWQTTASGLNTLSDFRIRQCKYQFFVSPFLKYFDACRYWRGRQRNQVRFLCAIRKGVDFNCRSPSRHRARI